MRRRFIDRAVFQSPPAISRRSTSIRKSRKKTENALLKEISGGDKPAKGRGDLLAVFRRTAGRAGRPSFVCHRLGFLDEIRQRFQDAFESITRTGLAVDIRYQTAEELQGVEAEPTVYAAALLDLLQRNRPQRHRSRARHRLGPHRDDIRFVLDSHEANSFASQGQLRALVLAWKTAEMDLMESSHGEPPVFAARRRLFGARFHPQRVICFEFLRARCNQCFITTTHPKHVLLTSERVDYEVKGGEVARKGE